MSKGYVPLFRWIRQSSFWKEKPFDKARALIDLYLEATFEKKRRIVVKNQFITLMRGQLVVSKWELARRWGWSREKVNRFFKSLTRHKGEPWAIKEETIRASVSNPKETPAALGTIVTFINFEQLVAEIEDEESEEK